jgi:hypothetical protein
MLCGVDDNNIFSPYKSYLASNSEDVLYHTIIDLMDTDYETFIQENDEQNNIAGLPEDQWDGYCIEDVIDELDEYFTTQCSFVRIQRHQIITLRKNKIINVERKKRKEKD